MEWEKGEPIRKGIDEQFPTIIDLLELIPSY